jgi:hypothetical protein
MMSIRSGIRFGLRIMISAFLLFGEEQIMNTNIYGKHPPAHVIAATAVS